MRQGGLFYSVTYFPLLNTEKLTFWEPVTKRNKHKYRNHSYSLSQPIAATNPKTIKSSSYCPNV